MQPKETEQQLWVLVANGKKLASSGLCRSVPVQLDTHMFQLDLYLFQLCRVELVLGVNWLRSLGLVQWDFSRMY